MEFKFSVRVKVQKPVEEVFEAVYSPEKLSGYFTTGGASGPLDPGTTVMWEFADYPGAIPVHVKEVEPNRLITFEWPANMERDYNTLVEMKFEPVDESATRVTISEGTWRPTEDGLNASYGNCEGWSNMAACLKAYAEYGINLRKGFF